MWKGTRNFCNCHCAKVKDIFYTLLNLNATVLKTKDIFYTLLMLTAYTLLICNVNLSLFTMGTHSNCLLREHTVIVGKGHLIIVPKKMHVAMRNSSAADKNLLIKNF